MGVALAGDGLFDKAKRLVFASAEEKAFREQVGRFLTSNPIAFEGSPPTFRDTCLSELNKAFKARLLSADNMDRTDIARQSADFRRYTDQHSLIKGATEAVAGVAKALTPQCPNLAQLLLLPPQGGPPLLVLAFGYFFRREVESNAELARSLLYDGQRQLFQGQAELLANLGQLSAAQAAAFDGLNQALHKLGDRLEWLEDAVLDIQAEIRRLHELHLANAGEVRSLLQDVQRQLANAGMQRGEINPRNSFSIRGDDERQAVHALLDRFRQLPAEQRQQMPALLNGLGKLQVGVGEFDGAQTSFQQVAAKVNDSGAKAEVLYNAYLAALERQQWDAALEAIRQAAALDRQRFAPFPMEKYRPVRILGAGGFGTVFLCQHVFFQHKDVVVKALHVSELARKPDKVFTEAHALSGLNHPAIIGVLDCSYAELGSLSRPYIVMPYFMGGTLEQFVEQRGTLKPEQLLAVADQIARGMKAAHAQGILHRDLKPGNILVRKEGEKWFVKIIDFGLALRREHEETQGGLSSTEKSILNASVAGTIKYAPPEQLGELPADRIGRHSDVYAFGKTCIYAWSKATHLGSKFRACVPPRWQPLLELVEECIEQDPSDRPRDFDMILERLGKLTGSGGTTLAVRGSDKSRRPGVIASIAEFLLAATATEPLTKAKIVDKLAQRFTHKDRNSMAATVNAQVPHRIQRERGITLENDGDGGFWAAKQQSAE